MNLKPFQNAEREFLLLKGQLATNRITRAQFDTALEKLNVRDEYGRVWRMEPENGAWQLQHNDAWVAADPKTYPAPASAQNKTAATNLPVFIALAAILALCVCGVGAFILLNATGVITTQLNLFRTATPTFVALATPTSTTTGIGTAPAQTLTQTIADTVTPTTADTSLPTNTIAAATVEMPETFVAFDADFSAAECPLFQGSNETREYSCALGEYYMLHKQAATRYTFYDAEYDSAVVDATGYFISGSGKYEYGVVVRADRDGTLYYVFTVTNDGKYNIALYQNEKYTDVVPYTSSSFVNTGAQANTFRVIMFGKQLIFLLNGHFIAAVPDNTLERGVVGLFFYNAEPGATVGFDQLTVSTFSPPTPTATPDANATPTRETVPNSTAAPTVAVKPGVYVNSLRYAPRAPKRGAPVTFFATFVNSTGRAQSYKWLVEIFRQNETKPYGQADAQQQQIPIGTNERATGDSWKVAGGGPCEPFRAHVVFVDDQGRRIPFKRTNGADLWVNFQVCP